MVRVDSSKFVALTYALAAGACQPAAAPAPANQPGGGQNEDFGFVTIPTAPDTPSEGEQDQPVADDGPPSGNCGDDAIGNPASCSTLEPPPGPHCEGFSHHNCEYIPTAMQPRIAEQAVECILAASGTRALCAGTVGTDCLRTAAMSACPPRGTEAECASILRGCETNRMFSREPFSNDECRRAIGATKPALRPKMQRCLERGCTLRCLWYLSPSVE